MNSSIDTTFDQHRFELEEMFCAAKEMESGPTAQTARDYEAVLDLFTNPGREQEY